MTYTYPTKEEFVDMLRNERLDQIVDEHLFAGMPFSFSAQTEVYQAMIKAISSGLQVSQNDICVVGSARIGFSLSPHKFGEPFGRYSDIDIIVVSSSLFDASWIDMLTNRRGMWSSFQGRTRDSLIEHREKYYIYNGWIYPLSVAEALSIGHPWLSTFNGLSRIPELSGRPISSRLYRTWDHARAYHRRSLRSVLKAISNQ